MNQFPLHFAFQRISEAIRDPIKSLNIMRPEINCEKRIHDTPMVNPSFTTNIST